MSINYNEIRNNFINNFNLRANGFDDPIIITDLKVGFTILKPFKPRINSNDEYISMIRVFIEDKNLKRNIDNMPVVLKLGCFLENGGNYSYIDQQKNFPINMVIKNIYSYNIKDNLFFDKRKKKVEAANTLLTIYKTYFNSSKKIQNLYWRIKIFVKEVPLKAYQSIEVLTCYALVFTTGIKYEAEPFSGTVKDKSSDKICNDTHESPADKLNEHQFIKINFFGYKISAIRIASYSFVHLLVFSVFYYFDYKPKYFDILFSNIFLTSMYIIFTLVVFEIFLPYWLKRLLKWSAKKRYTFLVKQFCKYN